MNLRKIKKGLATLAAGAVVLASSGLALKCLTSQSQTEDTKVESVESTESKNVEIHDGWVESKGWKITSYGHANEKLYSGEKIKVFDRDGKFLGLYRKDFLPEVEMNGSGVGDGIGNDEEQFLCYDYDINDEKAHYLINHTQGAYGNIIYNWREERPSVAVNPPLPRGTKIRFKDLNLKKELNHPWVRELLLSKTFHADDRFFLKEGEKHQKKCDVYVGVIEFRGYPRENYQALRLEDVTLLIEEPSLDLNKDGIVDESDIQTFEDNLGKEDRTQYLPGDLNYDNRVDSSDRAILRKRWEKEINVID